MGVLHWYQTFLLSEGKLGSLGFLSVFFYCSSILHVPTQKGKLTRIPVISKATFAKGHVWPWQPWPSALGSSHCCFPSGSHTTGRCHKIEEKYPGGLARCHHCKLGEVTSNSPTIILRHCTDEKSFNKIQQACELHSRDDGVDTSFGPICKPGPICITNASAQLRPIRRPGAAALTADGVACCDVPTAAGMRVVFFKLIRFLLCSIPSMVMC